MKKNLSFRESDKQILCLLAEKSYYQQIKVVDYQWLKLRDTYSMYLINNFPNY